MLIELRNAVKDVFSKQIRGLVWLTALTTLLVFIVLFCLFVFGMSFFELADSPKLEKTVEVLGYILFFIMSLMLFPAVAAFVSGFFIDSVVDRTAKKNNISGLRNVPLSESVVLSPPAKRIQCCIQFWRRRRFFVGGNFCQAVR